MYEYRHLTPEQRREIVQARLEKGHPPHSPPHLVTSASQYLLTAACYEHCCHLSTPERRARLLDEVFESLAETGAEVLAWSVLPNHYHLLADSVRIAALPAAYQRVHGRLARIWNLEDGESGRKVWYRYTDRAIRSERHFYTTLNYLHYNPVKHGWSASPYDWKESSVHWHLERFGRDWLRDLWVSYPVRDYGRGWDDIVNT